MNGLNEEQTFIFSIQDSDWLEVGESLPSRPLLLRGRPRRLRDGHPGQEDTRFNRLHFKKMQNLSPKDIKRSDHQVSASITLKVTVTLTELPGEAGAALQRRVVEGVPAVHQAGGGQSLDGAQSQQVGVLQHRPPRSILDASLQGAKAAVLRVAEHFDALTLNQVV